MCGFSTRLDFCLVKDTFVAPLDFDFANSPPFFFGAGLTGGGGPDEADLENEPAVPNDVCSFSSLMVATESIDLTRLLCFGLGLMDFISRLPSSAMGLSKSKLLLFLPNPDQPKLLAADFKANFSVTTMFDSLPAASLFLLASSPPSSTSIESDLCHGRTKIGYSNKPNTTVPADKNTRPYVGKYHLSLMPTAESNTFPLTPHSFPTPESTAELSLPSSPSRSLQGKSWFRRITVKMPVLLQKPVLV
mmetsp:Transcript_26049/g.49166  ORF Transcript_26049/g.49166 Transcript_26049/m.49166 type:complete len:247 (+) Transcript_26049:175-915(+)